MTEFAEIDNLTPAEKTYMIEILAERHPEVLDQLFAEVELCRKRDAVSATTPVHAFSPEPGYMLCYWNGNGVTCLRGPEHPLHS